MLILADAFIACIAISSAIGSCEGAGFSNNQDHYNLIVAFHF